MALSVVSRAVVAALVATASVARGQPAPAPPPSPAPAPPPSEAERLFQEGLALYEAGKYDEACARFELSLGKDPRAIGTLMNLGRCNERRGKIGTALKMFQEAYDRATEANLAAARDKAQERIAVLAPQVPVVKLHRAKPAAPGEKVVVDDVVVTAGLAELALDPGTHALVQTAPGRLPAQTSITVAMSERRTIELAELQLPATRIVEKDVSSRRTLGRIATFGGAGLALAGAGLFAYAKHDYDKQFDDPDGDGPQRAHCGAFPDIGGKASCDAHGQQRTDRDLNLGTIASVVAITGAVAATAGLLVWLTSPRREHRTIAVSPAPNGFVVLGRF